MEFLINVSVEKDFTHITIKTLFGVGMVMEYVLFI